MKNFACLLFAVIIKEESNQPYHPKRPGTNDPERQIYDPWGKSGAGAPRRDDRTGELLTQRPKHNLR